MKTIFYAISILVIAAAAFFSWSNSQKIQTQIKDYTEARDTKRNVERSIATTQGDLDDSDTALTEAKRLNSELGETKTNEIAKEGNYKDSIDEAEAKIAEHDAKLLELEQILAQIKSKIPGGVEWPQVPRELQRLRDERKTEGTRLDELNMLTAKLNKEVEDKRAERERQIERLADIRRKIALNSKEGRVTHVDPTWGFVIVNLGRSNSNITPQSELLIKRGDTLLGSVKPTSVEANQTVTDLNARDLKPGVRIQPGDRVILAEPVGN